MDDLISRQAALYSYQEVCNKVKCSECKATNEDGDCKLERWIKELPSAERRGRWVVKHGVLAGDGIYGDMGECSVCGLHLRNYEWDYCPNCGARMEALNED